MFYLIVNFLELPFIPTGIRILSQAALPIQTLIRQYLAKVALEKRYWGILKLQCYLRRFLSEEILLGW